MEIWVLKTIVNNVQWFKECGHRFSTNEKVVVTLYSDYEKAKKDFVELKNKVENMADEFMNEFNDVDCERKRNYYRADFEGEAEIEMKIQIRKVK